MKIGVIFTQLNLMRVFNYNNFARAVNAAFETNQKKQKLHSYNLNNNWCIVQVVGVLATGKIVHFTFNNIIMNKNLNYNCFCTHRTNLNIDKLYKLHLFD